MQQRCVGSDRNVGGGVGGASLRPPTPLRWEPIRYFDAVVRVVPVGRGRERHVSYER